MMIMIRLRCERGEFGRPFLGELSLSAVGLHPSTVRPDIFVD